MAATKLMAAKGKKASKKKWTKGISTYHEKPAEVKQGHRSTKRSGTLGGTHRKY